MIINIDIYYYIINARLKHEFTIHNEYIKYDMCKQVCIEIGDPPFFKRWSEVVS